MMRPKQTHYRKKTYEPVAVSTLILVVCVAAVIVAASGLMSLAPL